MENNEGYVYLLSMLNETGETVYKIGRAKDIDDRLKNYKFKKFLFAIKNNNYKDLENKLIKVLNSKYSLASGREYFLFNN